MNNGKTRIIFNVKRVFLNRSHEGEDVFHDNRMNVVQLANATIKEVTLKKLIGIGTRPRVIEDPNIPATWAG